MTAKDAELLRKAVNNVEAHGDDTGRAIALHSDHRSVVIYVLRDAFAFSFFDSRSAADREAQSPSLNI